jgi:hypothetical protein
MNTPFDKIFFQKKNEENFRITTMGRCALATLLTLFILLFTFALVLLIGRTVFLSSFSKSGSKVPPDLKHALCTLRTHRLEVCEKSWTIVWTLAKKSTSPSVTDNAIISPFHQKTTMEEAENDMNRYALNTTFPCMCPRGSTTENHTYSKACNFDHACMLDVEQVEFLQQEARRYKYAGDLLVAIGILLLLIALGGIGTVLFIMYCTMFPFHDNVSSEEYQKYVSSESVKMSKNDKHFVIGNEND